MQLDSARPRSASWTRAVSCIIGNRQHMLKNVRGSAAIGANDGLSTLVCQGHSWPDQIGCMARSVCLALEWQTSARGSLEVAGTSSNGLLQ